MQTSPDDRPAETFMPIPRAPRSPARAGFGAILALLLVGACSNSDNSTPPGVAPEPTVGSTGVLPGVVVTIETVRGREAGRAQVGERLSVDFTVATSDGRPLELSTMARGAIMVSGPTNNYQRVIASQADLLTRARKRALGAFTYDFEVAIPSTYLAPLNDTTSLSEGELTGQPLLGGTYTVGIEIRKDYTVDGVLYRDPGNTTKDFLIGSATTLEPREVVTLANCNQCHTELKAHGDNRNNIANCLLCHTSGAEDRNTASVAGGTPGVAIDFKVMIHKIHSGKHLPSVLGVATNPDGTRNYAAAPQPYELIGFGNEVADFSDVTWPAWPSFYSPMPRDVGFTTLSSTNQSKENLMRQGPAECNKCHGDPDGAGPLPAPAQGDLIYTQPTIAACASCHDDWNPEFPYTANLQTMPIQRDNAACKDCHRPSGTALDVLDAHRHPLVDDAVVGGLNFVLQSVTDVGNGDGRYTPGEKIEVTFRIENDAGAPVAASSLSTIESILSGPSTNPQMLSYMRMAPAYFSGNGPYTVKIPELAFYVPTGTSDGSLNTLSIPDAPIWNVTGAATTFLRVTGTGASTTLAAGAAVTQNYIDVVSSTGIVKDNYILLDGGTPGLREFLRVQWVQGNRLWFGSQFRTNYKPNLKIAHAIGASVQVVTTAAVNSGLSVDAVTGTVTETSEVGAGEILASYTKDYVIPAVYPGALDDSPVIGEDWGDWTGLALVDGTYILDFHGSRSFTVTRSGENTTYREGADSTAVNLLFGAADQEVVVSRIDPQACYGCHDSLQFHGGSRRSVEACLSCHGTAGAESTLLYENPTTGNPFGTSVEFRFLLHNLHNGVFPGMPGGVQDCAKCHGDNTAWQLPDERLHPNQGVPTRAWRAACSSCHSDSPAIAHIDANTSLAGAEACAVCHGANDTLSVTNVHKIK
ncbi:MAG: multiheme c-type cytochrome [Planctomycetota bacterium]|jgi:OmcA/MtrC family decaheme c-type cytochrome